MSIEERAERYACDELPECRDDVRDGYIQGATEQRKIDIEKARKWLLEHIEVPCTEQAESYFKASEERVKIADAFRKAMMEE